MISRRAFHAFLVAGLGAGSIALNPAVAKSLGALPNSKYRYRCRYSVTSRGMLSMWIRVKPIGDMSKSVPYKLIVSSDSEGKNILGNVSSVSEPECAYVSRVAVNLTKSGWKTGSPLYYRFLLGSEQIASKTWNTSRSKNA